MCDMPDPWGWRSRAEYWPEMSRAAHESPRSFILDLPFDMASARIARLRLHELLGTDIDPSAVHDIELVVHELVVNALVHGAPSPQGTFRLTCAAREEDVVVTVEDHGSAGQVTPRSHTFDQPNGRGLRIVEGLSRHWSATRLPHTVVTARMAAPRRRR